MSNIQVRLVTDFPVGFSNSFIPNFSFKADATAQGDFTINVPEVIPKTATAYIIAFREFLPKLPGPDIIPTSSQGCVFLKQTLRQTSPPVLKG